MLTHDRAAPAGYTKDMGRGIKYLRKALAAIIGIPVFIIGVILIPLPGPGILVCLLGLFILSLEFEWAKPYMEKLKKQADAIVDKAKSNQAKVESKSKTPMYEPTPKNKSPRVIKKQKPKKTASKQ